MQHEDPLHQVLYATMSKKVLQSSNIHQWTNSEKLAPNLPCLITLPVSEPSQTLLDPHILIISSRINRKTEMKTLK